MLPFHRILVNFRGGCNATPNTKIIGPQKKCRSAKGFAAKLTLEALFAIGPSAKLHWPSKAGRTDQDISGAVFLHL